MRLSASSLVNFVLLISSTRLPSVDVVLDDKEIAQLNFDLEVLGVAQVVKCSPLVVQAVGLASAANRDHASWLHALPTKASSGIYGVLNWSAWEQCDGAGLSDAANHANFIFLDHGYDQLSASVATAG